MKMLVMPIFILCLLKVISSDGNREGCVPPPTVKKVCEGDDVNLEWTLDKMCKAQFLIVTKSVNSLFKTLAEYRSSSVHLKLNETNFRDGGIYVLHAYFADGRSEESRTELVVLPSEFCPDKDKYVNPNLTAWSPDWYASSSSLVCGVTYSKITLSGIVPMAQIPVWAKIEVSGSTTECTGRNNTNVNCSMELFFSEQGNYTAVMHLEHRISGTSETYIQLVVHDSSELEPNSCLPLYEKKNSRVMVWIGLSISLVIGMFIFTPCCVLILRKRRSKQVSRKFKERSSVDRYQNESLLEPYPIKKAVAIKKSIVRKTVVVSDEPKITRVEYTCFDDDLKQTFLKGLEELRRLRKSTCYGGDNVITLEDHGSNECAYFKFPISANMSWFTKQNAPELTLHFYLQVVEQDINAVKTHRDDPTILSQVVRDVASGLHFLHENHISHGNLRPNNVFLFTSDRSNTRIMAKLHGFGNGMWAEDDTSKYSPFFSPPESVTGIDIDVLAAFRKDIWALGCLIHCTINPGITHPYEIEYKEKGINTDNAEILEELLKKKKKMPSSHMQDFEEAHSNLQELKYCCLTVEPQYRPKIGAIVRRLYPENRLENPEFKSYAIGGVGEVEISNRVKQIVNYNSSETHSYIEDIYADIRNNNIFIISGRSIRDLRLPEGTRDPKAMTNKAVQYTNDKRHIQKTNTFFTNIRDVDCAELEELEAFIEKMLVLRTRGVSIGKGHEICVVLRQKYCFHQLRTMIRTHPFKNTFLNIYLSSVECVEDTLTS